MILIDAYLYIEGTKWEVICDLYIIMEPRMCTFNF